MKITISRVCHKGPFVVTGEGGMLHSFSDWNELVEFLTEEAGEELYVEDLEAAKDECQELEEELKAVKEELEELEVDITDYQESINNLQTELDKAQEQYKSKS